MSVTRTVSVNCSVVSKSSAALLFTCSCPELALILNAVFVFPAWMLSVSVCPAAGLSGSLNVSGAPTFVSFALFSGMGRVAPEITAGCSPSAPPPGGPAPPPRTPPP